MKTEDESPLKKLREELAPWRLIGRLLAGFGSLFLVAGISSPLYSKEHDFSLVVLMVGFGVLLIFCAVLFTKPPFVQNRPRLWFPAVSGFLCSCCLLVLGACFAIVWRMPKGERPNWVLQLFFLAFAGCALFSLVCIITGISAFIKSKTNPRDEKPFSPKF
jgi:drug/metabolite transporter (DMT)-like permease